MGVTRETRELFAGFSALQRAQSDLMLRILGAADAGSAAAPNASSRRRRHPAQELSPIPTSASPGLRLEGYTRRTSEAPGDAMWSGSGGPLQYDRLRQHPYGLTAREIDVLQFVVAGLPNKEIARELKISPRTVELHRSHAREKLDARNGPDLVRRVWQLLG